MMKILNGFSWLECKLGENTNEIETCLEKGLIKYLYDDSQAVFIVLDNNVDKVKEILKDDYNKLEEWSLIKTLQMFFSDCYNDLEIQNNFGDCVNVGINNIIGLIEDDEETYFSNDKQLEVYNAENPADAMYDIINELGRFQAELQIRDLLNSVSSQKFN